MDQLGIEMETNKAVTVLGKTFNSEEERREYFRNELRKKLPELKQLEGFPIGEDEDIINLSDPPYYTACPNPLLNDFITEWEEEKEELQKLGERSADFEVEAPFAADVSEGKYDPIYLYHPYPTKVPHKAIMKYLLHYTQPGDIVYDGFAGTGMTGVAARMCSTPDNETKVKIEKEFKELNLKAPSWGSRNSIISDLSPLASYIAANYNTTTHVREFVNKANEILKKVKKECQWMFETKHSNGITGHINYVVWSDVFLCNQCSHEIVFWEEAVNKEAGKVRDEFSCPSCHKVLKKRNIEKAWVTSYDHLLGETSRQTKKVPVLINYTVGTKRFEKRPDEHDLDLINKIDSSSNPNWYPSNSMMDKGHNWGDTWRSGVHAGVTHVHQFYTYRNLYIISRFRELCPSSDFYILITKIAFQNTKLYRFTHQSGVWGAGGGPMSGTLYMPSLVKELNVLKQFESAIKDNLKISFPKEDGRCLIGVQTATNISQLPSNSIDYVFTDPPFGANLMYSELNFISESWLKVKTNNALEAIENRSQNKSVFEYQNLMSLSFLEYYRILKQGKWMTVEFSNTSAAIWNTIQSALQKAGFIIANVAALDKQKESFKAVTSPTAVKQDLVISCYKPSSEFDHKFKQHQHSEIAVWDFVDDHLQHLPIHIQRDQATTALIERSPKILFDRLIAFYVQRNLPVPIDAGTFQRELRDRFIERDGMFFTNEQVQEYDRKKADVPAFVQMNLFVANEQDSIYWLRNILEKEPKKEQDLHPLWMKEVASNMRKGDILPELRTILEENFLKDDAGKWYVADPENEVDLEKLRTKRLLKQFEAYKEQALKPKGKIKESRVEALRAGFKQCYQDKDFQTIVKVGDSIPNNLLMEDEVLLQFYDIASSRV